MIGFVPVDKLRESVEQTIQEPGGVAEFVVMLSSGRLVVASVGPVFNDRVAGKWQFLQNGKPVTDEDDTEASHLMEQLLGTPEMRLSSKDGVTEEQAGREMRRFFGGGQG